MVAIRARHRGCGLRWESDGPHRPLARATHRAVLTRAGDTRALLLPAHFAGPGQVRVRRDGSAFTFEEPRRR